MKTSTKRLLLLILMAFLVLPILGHAEEGEADPNLPGDPECRACHGTGRIEYGKKAGKIADILYCSYKDQGKRCKVLIGGWEPCLACEDWPGMQKIFDEHERIVKKYRSMASGLLTNLKKAGAPAPGMAAALSKHFQVYTNISHSNMHNLLIASEDSYKLFNDDFDMGNEGSDWDTKWTNRKLALIHVKSQQEFHQLVDWYFNSKYIDHNAKSMGIKRLKECAAIGFLGTRLSYLSPQNDFSQDERGVIKSASSILLSNAFITVKNNPFTAWLTEGYSAYHQQMLRANVTWYTVAYGMGTRQDQEFWGQFSNWKEGLAKANSVPKAKFDERTGSWKGLIPLETLIRMKVTQIPHQGLAQSWALVHYFLDTTTRSKSKRAKAKAKFKEFLKLVGSGTDMEAAMLQVYEAKKISSIEAKFRSWLRRFAR